MTRQRLAEDLLSFRSAVKFDMAYIKSHLKDMRESLHKRRGNFDLNRLLLIDKNGTTTPKDTYETRFTR